MSKYFYWIIIPCLSYLSNKDKIRKRKNTHLYHSDRPKRPPVSSKEIPHVLGKMQNQVSEDIQREYFPVHAEEQPACYVIMVQLASRK